MIFYELFLFGVGSKTSFVFMYFQDAETFCEEAANQQIDTMAKDNTLVINQLTQPKYKSKEKGSREDPFVRYLSRIRACAQS